MEQKDNAKKLVYAALAFMGAYAVYRIIFKNDTPKQAIKNTVEKPVKIVSNTIKEGEKVVKKFSKYIKGSPEAKAKMKELQDKRLSKYKNRMTTKEYKRYKKQFWKW